MVFILTGVIFFPTIHWLLGQTIAHEQLLHAFLVFLLTGALLILERRIPIKAVFEFDDTAQNTLICSYVLMVIALFTRINLIILLSLAVALTSFFLFAFGHSQKRLILSGTIAFSLYSGIAVFLPLFDWPLRTIAGQWAAGGLSFMGKSVELGLLQSPSGPQLLLLSNGRPFHVAAEWNGFGMITSCLLLTTIVTFYQKMKALDRIGWLALALITGIFFNACRIIIIVLLAPTLPDNAYMIMHEAVGLLTTYGGLGALYYLLIPREEPITSPQTQTD